MFVGRKPRMFIDVCALTSHIIDLHRVSFELFKHRVASRKIAAPMNNGKGNVGYHFSQSG